MDKTHQMSCNILTSKGRTPPGNIGFAASQMRHSVIFSVAFLLAIFISCNSTDQKSHVDTIPFPRIEYQSVKIFSVDRDKEQNGTLKPMTYLVGNEATGIIDSTGNPITKKIKTIVLSQSQIDNLSIILRPRPIKKNEKWTDGDCMPAYRDAIIFFDKNKKPVAWVNVCFTCERTMFVPTSQYMFGFDLDQHLELRQFFKNLGYVPEGRP